jgi:DNA-binding MarR family transcriptional regulator
MAGTVPQMLETCQVSRTSTIEVLERSAHGAYYSIMRVNRSTTKRDIATQVWRMLAEFTSSRFQSGGHFGILRELGLTPGHMKALAALDPDEPRPMRALAEALSCDASMVTWLVDRMEERGLVERRALTSDRRVKTVALTRLGVDARDRLLSALYEPPPELLSLDTPSLEALRIQLSKLPAPSGSLWSHRSTQIQSASAVPAVGNR